MKKIEYLQVISLFPTSCELGWMSNDIVSNNNNNNKSTNLLDFEYFIKEIGNEYDRIVGHTYNRSNIELTNLQPNKTYKFVVISRYWDPLARQTTDNGYNISKYSNYVIVTTPSEGIIYFLFIIYLLFIYYLFLCKDL